MNEIELLKSLFELTGELHQEYQDDDNHYVIDAQKDGNILTVKVEKIEKDDKKEFEQWVNQLDDNLFEEIWESLAEEYSLKDLNDLYDSPNYKEVIKLFKNKGKSLVEEKIAKLESLFNFSR